MPIFRLAKNRIIDVDLVNEIIVYDSTKSSNGFTNMTSTTRKKATIRSRYHATIISQANIMLNVSQITQSERDTLKKILDQSNRTALCNFICMQNHW